jgi:hypothetical protein
MTAHGDIIAEATGASGAVVTFTLWAMDLVDTSLVIVCNPSSGSTFALGTTTVTCTATDWSGNSAQRSFFVEIRDTESPVFIIPEEILREATGPSGAVVSYAVKAADIVDVSPRIDCSPLSGSTFPLGETTVTCIAMDEVGNEASVTFTITVRDETKPTLQLPPGNVIEQATESWGAIVTFEVTAEDAVDPSPAVKCLPASGSRFAVGETAVTCTARDSSGNVATASFKVTVQVPEAVGPYGFAVDPWVFFIPTIMVASIGAIVVALQRRRKNRGAS